MAHCERIELVLNFESEVYAYLCIDVCCVRIYIDDEDMDEEMVSILKLNTNGIQRFFNEYMRVKFKYI